MYEKQQYEKEPEKMSQGEAIELVEARHRHKKEDKIQEEIAKINLSFKSYAEYME